MSASSTWEILAAEMARRPTDRIVVDAVTLIDTLGMSRKLVLDLIKDGELGPERDEAVIGVSWQGVLDFAEREGWTLRRDLHATLTAMLHGLFPTQQLIDMVAERRLGHS